MQIRVNIKKSHVISIISAIFLVGIVIAYGGTQPNVVGHTDGEIRLPVLGQNLDVWSSSVESRISSQSGSLTTLSNSVSSSYCHQSGTNCPTMVRRTSSTSSCSGGSPTPNAFYCGAVPYNVVLDLSAPSATLSYITPFWDGSRWRAGSGGVDCVWILCNS